ncbi:histamine H2 receptor-like [Diadema antillarum]|uniref:histamine H2 receptor-like n=1 Tax=Diadema antillarum TaxID=105358 RepID=UPI003A857B80
MDVTTESPDFGSPGMPATELLAYNIAHSVNAIFTVLLNVLLLRILQRQRTISDVSRLIHSVMTVLDLCMGLCWNTWSILWYTANDAENCRLAVYIFLFPHRFLAFCILATMCVISIDKYVFITRPLRYPLLVTPNRVAVVLAALFTASFLLCITHLPLPSWSRVTDIIIANCINQFGSLSEWENLFKSLFLVVPISITIVVATFSNFRLLHVARQQSRAIAALKPGGLAPRRSSSRGVTTVILLTLPFYICWVPWIVFLTLQDLSGQLAALDFMGAATSLIRPVIYMATTREARDILAAQIRKKTGQLHDRQ